MELKLIPAETREQRKRIKSLYQKAFPKNERRPFFLMLQKQREGKMDLLSIETKDGDFVGEAITIKDRDLLLLDYFAIDPKWRGEGCGSEALRLLRETYADRRFLLEIECENVPCKNREERIRRKNFYLRNGMQLMDYTVHLFGEIMYVLTAENDVTFEEYHDIFTNVFGKRAAAQVWRQSD